MSDIAIGSALGLAILMCVIFCPFASYFLVRFWPAKWTPTVRRYRRELAETKATQERKAAAERIRERRKWWPWVQMSAWDDAYQSISEQAGIKCDGCNEDRRGNGGFVTRYQPSCPLHKHRWRTLSPVYKHYRRHHLADAHEVLDRLDITPPRYTNEGTLL